MEDSLILRHLQENCIRSLAALPCHYLAQNIFLSQQLQSVHNHAKRFINKNTFITDFPADKNEIYLITH